MLSLVNEIFEKVEAAKTVNERVEILNKNKSPRLEEFVGLWFNETEWYIEDANDIPEWYPAKEELGFTPSNIYHELRRFYLFEKGNEKITIKRKDELLAQILESVHRDEATIIVSLLCGTLKVKGFTKNLVKKVWPDLIKEIKGNTDEK